MALFTSVSLQNLLPKCKDPDKWVEPLNDICPKYDINSPDRLACFLAQVAHESGSFNTLTENLNFSATRLMAVWPKRFPDMAVAAQYAGNPQKLANYVYANRMGNGDAASGDGYNFRGRGLIQLTGRSNYQRAGQQLNLPLLANPDLLLEPRNAVLSAAWFWASLGLNELADDKTADDDLEDFKLITKRINGGLNGLTERANLALAIRAKLKS